MFMAPCHQIESVCATYYHTSIADQYTPVLVLRLFKRGDEKEKINQIMVSYKYKIYDSYKIFHWEQASLYMLCGCCIILKMHRC